MNRMQIKLRSRMRKLRCTFNPSHRMNEGIIYGLDYPISYGINANLETMAKSIPSRERGEYDPNFIDWFISFHAELFHPEEWSRFPGWMVDMLKRRSIEIHGDEIRDELESIR